MEIAWLGHSCLRLRTNSVTLITDPYRDSVGFPMARQKADIVMVSHAHPHHAYCEALDGSPRVLMGPGEYEVSSIYVSGMGTPRFPGTRGDRQINTVFTLWAEGLTLCHLGDLGQPLSPGQLGVLDRTDVLFVPAGGVCTIGPARVAELVNLINPRIVVPMHYLADGVKVELEPLSGFLRELGVSDVVTQMKLNVTPTNLPPELRVVVLQRVP